MKQEFALGLSYWWRGWGRLRRSRALGFYAVMPMTLATVSFLGLIWVTINKLHLWTDHLIVQLLPKHEIWAHVLYYPMWLTLFLLALVALIFVAYLIHIVLCGPFYSLLADRTLQDLGKIPAARFRFSARIVWVAILKAAVFFSLGTLIFIFSFVPLVNFFGLLLTLMMLAFDTMDYAFDAMEMGFRARLRYFFAHLPQWLGMAVSLALTLLVPGLTLLILPGAVVGAAMIFEPRSN